MTVKVVEQKFRLDWLKWLFVLLLVIAGVAGNSYYDGQPILYRVLCIAWNGYIWFVGIYKYWKRVIAYGIFLKKHKQKYVRLFGLLVKRLIR